VVAGSFGSWNNKKEIKTHPFPDLFRRIYDPPDNLTLCSAGKRIMDDRKCYNYLSEYKNLNSPIQS
jgi:hypothetical protein